MALHVLGDCLVHACFFAYVLVLLVCVQACLLASRLLLACCLLAACC